MSERPYISTVMRLACVYVFVWVGKWADAPFVCLSFVCAALARKPTPRKALPAAAAGNQGSCALGRRASRAPPPPPPPPLAVVPPRLAQLVAGRGGRAAGGGMSPLALGGGGDAAAP